MREEVKWGNIGGYVLIRYCMEVEFELLGQSMLPYIVAAVFKFILMAIVKYKKRNKNQQPFRSL